MTEDQFNQAVDSGQVSITQPDGFQPLPEPTPAFDKNQPVIESIRKPRQTLTVAPTFTPKSFAESIQYYDDGTNQRVYFYFNGAWRPVPAVVPLISMFDKFIDIVHWNSIDGFTVGGTGGSIAIDDGHLLISSDSTINHTKYLNSNDVYPKICETGKLLTVEWQISDLSHVDTYEIYLHFTTSVAFTPSLTAHHFGFTFLGSGSGFFATVGDGTTETKVDITSSIPGGYIPTGPQRLRLKVICNRGTDVKFYVNDVLATTITTNIPNTDGLGFNMGIKTLSGVQRYFSINRIMIQKEY